MRIVKTERYEEVNNVDDLDKVIYDLMNKHNASDYEVRIIANSYKYNIKHIIFEEDNYRVSIVIDD